MIFIKRKKQESTRDGYGRALLELGRTNSKVIVLSADLKNSTRCSDFAQEFPERFVEVGVAEQNMASLAAGMAYAGYIPFISSFASFSPGRNWEQIRSCVCYPNLNVKIASTHAGVTTGADGATHQSLEDIAITRVIPNMTVIAPCDSREAYLATLAAANEDGPFYIRLTRSESDQICSDKEKFEIGKAKVLQIGKDVTIFGCGPILNEAILAAKILKQKHYVSADVINCHTIKPLDEKTVFESVSKTGCAVCVEEHQIAGGLGGAIAEFLIEKYPVPMRFVGMPDKFGESGEPQDLLEKYGMTKEKIISSVFDVLKQKTLVKN